MQVKEKIEQVIALIEKTGDALREIYKKQDLSIEMKPDATPLTEADKLSNEMLSQGLKAIFPEIPVISEESNLPDFYTRRKWKYVWLVDPLDGTKEFIYKNGRFCINIALIDENKPVFGMIYNIQDNEILWAFKDEDCYIRKDGVNRLLQPVTGSSTKLKVAVSRFNITEAEFEYFDHLQSKGYTLELVPLGASSKQCEVAKGTIDIYPKFGRCYEWDSAAGQVIVETAGGLVVNPENYSSPEYNKKESMVNPPFIMFNERIKEQIEEGNDNFIHYTPGRKRG